MRHNVDAQKLIWEMDMARVMQLIYCDATNRGAVMRYANAIESESTNRKLEELERNLEQWQSEHQ